MVAHNGSPLRLLECVAQRYGKIAALGPFTVLSAPQHFHHVLVTQARKYDKKARAMSSVIGDGLTSASGETWRQQREQVAPFFQHAHIEKMAGPIETWVDRHLDTWVPAARSGEARDLAREMSRLNISLAGSLLFGCDFSAHAAAIEENLAAVEDHHFLRALGAFIPNAPRPDSTRYAMARGALRGLAGEILGQRSSASASSCPHDLISHFPKHHPGQTIDEPEYLTDQALTFFLAAFFNPSTTLSLSLAFSARHPELEGTPEQRWLECTRLFPPVYHIIRTANETDMIDGFLIPEGTTVMLFPYAAHRDQGVWGDDAGEFKPSRMTQALVHAREASADFIPFGRGPRHCIGRALASLQMTTILRMVFERYDLRLCDEHAPIEPLARLNLHAPREGIWFTLRERV